MTGKSTVQTRLKSARRALRDPRRTLSLLRTGQGWHRLLYVVRPPAHGSWIPAGEGRLVRSYAGYDDYVKHQSSKLKLLDLTSYDESFGTELQRRFAQDALAGTTVLCLAARRGTEVKAFRALGAFAVGIDVEPGVGNPFVLSGDFHHLDFPGHCVDVVYCNSFDHALDFPAVLAEIHRVLKPNVGRLITDVQLGSAQAGDFDEWAATSWPTVDHLIDALAGTFELERRKPISNPWPGEELRLRPT